MALVMTGLTSYKNLNVPQPVYVAIAAAGPALKWLTYFINIGAILGLASVVLVMLMGQPRIFFSMSRDGLLPAVFGKVHPKFQTPYVTTIVTGIVAALVAGFFPIALLGELVSIGTLLAFVIVCVGVMVLALRAAEHPASVPHAARAGRSDPRHSDLRLHDVQPAGRHLDPARRLDGHRSGHLLPLRHGPLARRRVSPWRPPATDGGAKSRYLWRRRPSPGAVSISWESIGTTCRTRSRSIWRFPSRVARRSSPAARARARPARRAVDAHERRRRRMRLGGGAGAPARAARPRRAHRQPHAVAGALFASCSATTCGRRRAEGAAALATSTC